MALILEEFRQNRCSESHTLLTRCKLNFAQFSAFSVWFRCSSAKEILAKICWVTLSVVTVGAFQIYRPIWVKFGIRDMHEMPLRTGEIHEILWTEGYTFSYGRKGNYVLAHTVKPNRNLTVKNTLEFWYVTECAICICISSVSVYFTGVSDDYFVTSIEIALTKKLKAN
jgi:hypothetical protein